MWLASTFRIWKGEATQIEGICENPEGVKNWKHIYQIDKRGEGNGWKDRETDRQI